MEGRELEILRRSNVPAPLGARGLQLPVAAIPLRDGTSALVLDSPAPGSFRLREVHLGTGKELRSIATPFEGQPTAMALEPSGASALVAVDGGGFWRVARVDLREGTTLPVLSAGASLERGVARCIVSVGTGAALLTAGSSLVRLNLSDPARAQAATVLSGLKTPWGIAVDPLRPNRVYLAERDFVGPSGSGRVLAVDLDTLAKAPLATGALNWHQDRN